VGDKASTLASTQPPKPKPAPTQPSKAVPEKKRKLVKETPDEPSPAKRSKGVLVGKIHKPRSPLKLVEEPSAEDVSVEEPGVLVGKIRKPRSPLKLVEEPIAEDVSVEEPVYNEEEANLQWALELSLKEQAERTQGPARPMVIMKFDSGRIQPLPDVQGKGKNKAGSNPGDAAESQPQSSHVVHARPNREHIDLEDTDASTRQNPKQMDEEFTTTAYPNVQENLKLPYEDSEEEPGKTNAEAEVQSMVLVPINQDISSVPPMTTPFIDFTTSQSGSPLPTSTNPTSIITTTTSLPPPPQQSTAYPTLVKRKDELEQHMIKKEEMGVAEKILMLLKYLEHQMRRLEEVEAVAVAVETQKEFLVSHISFFSFGELLPELIGVAYETPAENSLLAKTEDMTNFLNWYYRQVNKTALTPVNLEGQAYEVVKAFYPDAIHLYKGSSPTLSISKMKAASYPDFGLELLMPEQMWIDDVCTYDISAKYGISHMWFNRQKFYIDRHASPSRRKEFRSNMQILSVVIIKAYSRYGYDYLSETILRRAYLQEHTIAEKDFKNLYPSDFEDPNMLLLQGHLDHLLGFDKRMLSTAVKLWTQNLATSSSMIIPSLNLLEQ
nr:hypothetical protein [Tanacetum cinerariifolium]